MTLVVPATDPPLASVADFEALTGTPSGPGTALQLDVASSLVRDWCRWQISLRAQDTVEVEGRGSRLLALPTLWLLKVYELRRGGEALDPDSFKVWRHGLIELLGGGVPGSYTAIVDHGYQPVPASVMNGTVVVAQQMAANPSGARSVAVGNVAVTYGSGGAVDLAAIPGLAEYRIPPT